MNNELKAEFREKYPELRVKRSGKIHPLAGGILTNMYLEDCTESIWEWIDQKLKEAYLQGAKDMKGAVKLEKTNKITRLTQLHTGDVTDGAVGYEVGYNSAVYKMKRKAQQFIDSLEKGEKNE